jgi:hypothetical protein
MALLMKLRHVVINKGKFVYQRRFPTDLSHLYPKTFFGTRFRKQEEGAALVSEHAALQASFTRMVADARAGSPEAVGAAGIARYIAMAWSDLDDPRTEREKWSDLKEEAEALVRSVRGLGGSEHSYDDAHQERREIIADEIERTGGSPMLYRAVTQPEAAAPVATLADAAKVYEKERLGEAPKKSAKNTFNKIKRRLENSLGPLDRLSAPDMIASSAAR